MIKKGLIWLVVGSLVLSSLVGCGKAGMTSDKKGESAANKKTENTSNKNVEMGRYIEQEVSIEGLSKEYKTFLLKTKENKLQIYQQLETGIAAFEEQEDLSWKKIEPEWLPTFNEKYGSEWLSCMALDDKDQPYFVRVGEPIEGEEEATLSEDDGSAKEEENTIPESIRNTRTTVISIKEGKLETCQLRIEGELGYIIPDNMVVLDDKNVVLYGQNQEQTHYSLETGKEVGKYAGSYGHMAYNGEQLYSINTAEKNLEIYDAKKGELEEEVACKDIEESAIPLLKEDKGLYLVSKQGILYYAGEGEIWEKLIESTGFSLSLPSYGLEGCVEKDGRFVTLMLNDQYQYLVRQYVFSETTPTLPTVELSAYSLEGNKSVQEVLIAYQLAHPEVRIELQSGVNEESGITKTDAIKALNTEILAGKGPDLLVLDGLPIETYIEKGALSDLSGLSQLDNLFSFTKKSFIKEDKLYAVPLRFTVPTLWGRKSIVETADSLKKLAQYQEAHKDKVVLFNQPSEVLIRRFACGYEDQWFNEKGELKEEALAHFLEQVNVFVNPAAELDEAMNGVSPNSFMDYVFGEVEVFDSQTASILDLLMGNAGKAKKGDGSFTLMKEEGKRFCIPSGIVAINAASTNKEAMEEIIDFMLQENNQLIDTKEGFPALKSAMEKWIKGETTNKDVSYGFGRSMTDTLCVEWGYEEELQAFLKEVNQIEETKIEDKDLLEMIIEGSKPYFTGKQSVEEAVSGMKDQLELYKQE